MSVFDKFFERYSYRFPKGYPDFTNKQDILILENILDEINLFEANTAEGNKFIEDAFEAGAKYCITDKEYSKSTIKKNVLYLNNVFSFLKALSMLQRPF